MDCWDKKVGHEYLMELLQGINIQQNIVENLKMYIFVKYPFSINASDPCLNF